MKKVRKIALTGGIGSGKTTALNTLRENGFAVFSCDEISHKFSDRRSVKKQMKKLFPQAVKGKIFIKVDRKKVAEEVFNDKEKLEKLNNLLHPLILKELLKKASRCGEKVAFIEVPLLFESGYEKYFDGVIIINRNIKERIDSVKIRSKLTEEEIIARMNNQADYENMDLSTYTVIKNEGNLVAFKKSVLAVAENILLEGKGLSTFALDFLDLRTRL